MPEIPPYYWSQIKAMFNILITALILVSCTSSQSVPIKDRSQLSLNRPKTHIVIPGETLFSIAWRYGLKYEDLAKYNHITAPYVIRPAQVIKLDMGRSKLTSQQSSDKPNLHQKKITGSGAQDESQLIGRKENKSSILQNRHQKKIVWNTPQWQWPLKGPLLSSFQGNNGLNKGIDLGGKLGEPVLAAAAGQIVYSGSGLRGYGKLLIIKHNEVFLSAYAHNNVLLVKEGEFVKVGQKIADMGSSGTDRVKLHFEIRRDGTPVDPLKFLPRR